MNYYIIRDIHSKNKQMIEAKGYNGTLILTENSLIIKRNGFLSKMQFGSSDKEIPLRSITALLFKETSMWSNLGYIQIIYKGSIEKQVRILNGASSDENTILFKKNQEKIFQEIKTKVNNIISSGFSNVNSANQTTGLNDLEKLAELKAKGIITEEEFSLKKKQILGI